MENSRTSLSGQSQVGTKFDAKKSWFVPSSIVEITKVADDEDIPEEENCGLEPKTHEFNLNFAQRLFLLFDQPDRSVLGGIISVFTMITIITSCVAFILSSSERFNYTPDDCDNPACDDDPTLCPGKKMCQPVEFSSFFTIEVVCIVIFTIDYVVRVSIVPWMPTRLAKIMPLHWDRKLNRDHAMADPVYPWYKSLWLYGKMPLNLVDLFAIIPFYIGLMVPAAGGNSASVIRIVRLVRILRIFKVASLKSVVRMIGNSISKSLMALVILLFFTIIGVILFGSLIYAIESGEYVVDEDFPDGAYVRWNIMHTEKEESPFSSILISCYWAVVTSTTVGYGDLYPTTSIGRFVAIILMYCGLIVLALPISVLGSAFTDEYNKLHQVPLPKATDKVIATKGEVVKKLGEIAKQVEALTQQLQQVALSVQAMDGEASVGDDGGATMNELLRMGGVEKSIELRSVDSTSDNK